MKLLIFALILTFSLPSFAKTKNLFLICTSQTKIYSVAIESGSKAIIFNIMDPQEKRKTLYLNRNEFSLTVINQKEGLYFFETVKPKLKLNCEIDKEFDNNGAFTGSN